MADRGRDARIGLELVVILDQRIDQHAGHEGLGAAALHAREAEGAVLRLRAEDRAEGASEPRGETGVAGADGGGIEQGGEHPCLHAVVHLGARVGEIGEIVGGEKDSATASRLSRLRASPVVQ